MVLESGDYEFGSTSELIAMYAKQKLNKIRRLETLLLVKSNLVVASAIINKNETKFEGVQKLMQEYSEEMFPELIEEREKTAKQVQSMIRHESSKVLKITQNATQNHRMKLTRRS